MKAVRSHLRGGPETLVYEDSPEPRVAAGEALVRVHAAAIIPTELTWNSTWANSKGKDRRPIVPSFEVSGTVERLGPGKADAKRGDPVYGLLNFWRDGAAAEFVAARAADLAPKPDLSIMFARLQCPCPGSRPGRPCSNMRAWRRATAS